ncbi:MAG: EamA family transporter RarD [Geminicoccaceae bacterium]
MLSQAAAAEGRRGFAAGLSAYLFWGLFPFYFKSLEGVGAYEIFGWRIVFSTVTLALMVPFGGHRAELFRILRDRRALALLAAAALMLCGNWLFYVIAVKAGHVLDASLGYFMCPLVMVALGIVVLGERLRPLQIAAVALAATAVLAAVVLAGVVPKTALLLAVSFGIYGLLRKRVAVGPVVGLFIECVLTLPVAVGVLVWQGTLGAVAFPTGATGIDLLVCAAGLVTVAPLLLFGYAARRLALSTLGLLQYIAPSVIFIEGVVLFGEPLPLWRLLSFLLIWVGLVLYTVDGIARSRADPAVPSR